MSSLSLHTQIATCKADWGYIQVKTPQMLKFLFYFVELFALHRWEQPSLAFLYRASLRGRPLATLTLRSGLQLKLRLGNLELTLFLLVCRLSLFFSFLDHSELAIIFFFSVSTTNRGAKRSPNQFQDSKAQPEDQKGAVASGRAVARQGGTTTSPH